MENCLTCEQWNLDTCGLTGKFTTMKDTCDNFKKDSKFTWALMYTKPNSEEDQLFDVYKTKKEAQLEVAYLEKVGYNNIRITDLKKEDVN